MLNYTVVSFGCRRRRFGQPYVIAIVARNPFSSPTRTWISYVASYAGRTVDGATCPISGDEEARFGDFSDFTGLREAWPSDLRRAVKTLFEELPQHCVVLLEDIDAVGSNRTGNSNKDVSQSTSSTQMPALKRSAEGRVLIMTTNHIEHLDPALIRPGRVDTKVEFPLADEDLIGRLFFFVYKGVTCSD